MICRQDISDRRIEARLLALTSLIVLSGFLLVAAGLRVRLVQNPPAWTSAFLFPIVFSVVFFSIHLLLRMRRVTHEQVLLPLTALVCGIGLITVYRLLGSAGVWQQLGRGLLPGLLVVAALILRPNSVEKIRRLAIPLSVVGLALSFATAFFGIVDETGARLALKIGPLPPMQTSEVLKIALIIFLAWFIEREGREVAGRARPAGWLRLPAVRYFIPAGLFVSMGTIALVQMADFGAVIILGVIFFGMIYAGFETRIFTPIALTGLVLALLVGVVLFLTWELPTVIRFRFLAFLDPWSEMMLTIGEEPIGVTVSQGPGYQIQQGIYGIIAGGLTGTGLGLGTPEYIPLAHSDFIFAAILEEMGFVIGVPILIVFVAILLRLLRLAAVLPEEQAFERLLLTGIAIHLFTQLLIMVGGTLNLIPVTGVTIPFLSLGGMALLINISEIGIAIALVRRLEMTSA